MRLPGVLWRVSPCQPGPAPLSISIMSESTLSTLTQEQRDRIAGNRAEALRRASAWRAEAEADDDADVVDDEGDIETIGPQPPQASSQASASSSYQTGIQDDLDHLELVPTPTPTAKREHHGQKRPRTWYRSSPNTLDETLGIVEEDVCQLIRMQALHGVNYKDNLNRTLEQGVVMTTCFSGTLAAEHVGARIFQQGAWAGKLVLWSACDILPVCEKIACHHVPRSKPLHYFPNILDRLPDRVLEKLVKVETTALAKFQKLKRAYKGDIDFAPTISKVEFEAGKKDMGIAYAKKLKRILQRTVFKRTSWCSFHETECPVSPRECPNLSLKRMRWVEVAGTTCCPWASIGSHNHMMDKATLPCLTWIYASKYYEPDDIVHECSPNFRPEQLERDLNKTDPEGEDEGEDESDSDCEGLSHHCYPKCPSSRPTDPTRGADDATRTYKMFSLRFSPVDRGIPMSRKRVYTWFRLSLFVDILVEETCLQSNFQDMFFAECTSNASIYMVASEQQLLDHQRSWVDAKSMGWMVDYELEGREGREPPVPPEDQAYRAGMKVREIMSESGPFLDPAFKIRSQKYLEHYNQIEPPPPVNIVNLMQTSEFFGPCTVLVVPSLLRNSWLYDIASSREVLPVQHLLMLGFPVPGMCGLALSRHFPFPGIVSCEPSPFALKWLMLSDTQIRTVTGNAFHLSSIGAFLTFIWAVGQLQLREE